VTADTTRPDNAVGQAPERAGLVLAALILVAGVANLNLSVANVALPDIGKHFDSSQTTMDLIAVGYSLGPAASVLYLGALGDRYGRKLMLLLGMALSVRAYGAGIVAVVLGAALVFFAFPKKEREQQLLGESEAEDAAQIDDRPSGTPGGVAGAEPAREPQRIGHGAGP
jgi:MFS family permease